MNLNALRTFQTIVETGSLVRTAAQLNVTQSTITARLKSLEEELGQTLINRNKSGATLTSAGQRLLRYAETISDLWQQARQETSLPDQLKTICNLTCHPDLWPNLGQRFFDHLRASQPNIALSVWTGGQYDIAQWMQSGRADLALTYWPQAQTGEECHRIGRDRLILVADKPDRPIRFDPGYIFVEGGDVFGREHAATYADADTARLSFGSAELGLAHLVAHGGTAYLPERIAAPKIAQGSLFQLRDAPEFSRDIFLIVRSNERQHWPWFDAVINATLMEEEKNV